MSRLRRAVVMPANGWLRSAGLNQRLSAASESFSPRNTGNQYPLQDGLPSKPKDFVNIQFDGDGKQPLGPRATEALEQLRGRAEGRNALAKSGAVRPTKEEVVGLRELFGQDTDGARDLIRRLENGPIEQPHTVTRETLENYAKLAENSVATGIDKNGVQALRLEALRKILGTR